MLQENNFIYLNQASHNSYNDFWKWSGVKIYNYLIFDNENQKYSV